MLVYDHLTPGPETALSPDVPTCDVVVQRLGDRSQLPATPSASASENGEEGLELCILQGAGSDSRGWCLVRGAAMTFPPCGITDNCMEIMAPYSILRITCTPPCQLPVPDAQPPRDGHGHLKCVAHCASIQEAKKKGGRTRQKKMYVRTSFVVFRHTIS